MIIFRYRAPGLPCVLEYLQNTAVCASPLRYIRCKQSAWYRGCKLLRATPPPSSMTHLSPPLCIKATDTETAHLGKAQCATGS